ncbi:cysteine hydrolase family protein [Rhodococcus qingshengii]|uniref:cysteine hydrolase family protein n=1 Tax=Rhodococcus qingshengii TaxID=334542 RepID=UPI001C22D852|nr:cysteine hydrolase [Rhodococcus qingshengii]QXC46872.1 cysteine hydrolase [Rhodococcus qingshengii]
MKTALLVIDMQNGFCREDGSFSRAGFVLPNMDKIIAQNVALIAAARAQDVPVIFTRHVLRPGKLDADTWLKNLPLEDASLQIGSWDADIITELAPESEDVVVDKNRFDAFLYTELETILRALNVRNIVVSGVVTSVCVESTVRSGYQRGFDMFVASDATSARGSFHDAALDIMGTVFAQVGSGLDMLKKAITGP